MLIFAVGAGCFILGWGLGIFNYENRLEEEKYEEMERRAKLALAESRKQEYLDYIWRSRDE